MAALGNGSIDFAGSDPLDEVRQSVDYLKAR